MKIFSALLIFVFITVGCKRKTEADVINNAIIQAAGVFITENIHSVSKLQIRGKTEIKEEKDSVYYVTGSVEGFSPLNYPVKVEHFSERLHFLGGDINQQSNWECIEIYVGKKKMK